MLTALVDLGSRNTTRHPVVDGPTIAFGPGWRLGGSYRALVRGHASIIR